MRFRAEAGTGVMLLFVVAAASCADGGSVAEPEVAGSAASVAAGNGAFYGGVFLGDAVTTPEKVAGAIGAYAAAVGKRPALVKTFHHLNADLSPAGWSGRVTHEIARTGSTNYMALDLDWPGRRAGSLLQAINAGEADALLARAARSIAQLNAVVLVEPAWEMNGNWNYGWQGALNGANATAPARYAEAWRRVVDIFRSNGATNVRWVFNPNVGNAFAPAGAGPSHWNWYGNYYPGDAYVDYVGGHGYNGPGVWGHAYKTFLEVFYGADSDHMITDMAARYPGKPIIIGEMAAEETPGRDKGAWIASAYAEMRKDSRIVGAIWFDTRKEADWRIASSASSLRAYRASMQDARVRESYDDRPVAQNAVMLARR